jgi:hypothetical protein
MKMFKQLVLAATLAPSAFLATAASAAITLSVEINPNPVKAGEVVVAEFTVANDGGSAVNLVTLQSTVPANINDFNASILTGGATCTVVVNNGLCDSGEVMVWNLGTVPGGAAVTLSVPLVVTAGT